jgi:methylenetetrahydrofolate dehydrogenase (NADP+)/methenyltetrahydrofolate cyclohydrolase
MATLIDGRAYAADLERRVRDEMALLPHGRVGIATILIGEDYAAEVYQRRIDTRARAVGMNSVMVRMSGDSTLGQVVGKIAELDVDDDISGILVLRPTSTRFSPS